MSTWQERDLAHIWHPCSQMKDYETLKPIVIDHGKGIYLYDIDGNEYIDIVSSWWCNLLGHCNPTINECVKNQIDTLEHVIFANFTHKPAIELTEQLMNVIPKGLNKFNFSDNGSAAVECSLKMAFQYHYQTGHPEKIKFMCLSDGYHGETIGALSVGTLDLYAKIYNPMLMDTIRVQAPDCYRCPYGKNRDDCNCECFEHAEKSAGSGQHPAGGGARRGHHARGGLPHRHRPRGGQQRGKGGGSRYAGGSHAKSGLADGAVPRRQAVYPRAGGAAEGKRP